MPARSGGRRLTMNNQARVLIAEDNAEYAEYLKNLLEENNIRLPYPNHEIEISNAILSSE